MCIIKFSQKKLLSNLLIFTLVMSLFLITSPVTVNAASNYYVSTTGNDNNPGTQNQPFRTIQKAANVVNPGDTVLVMNGVYNEAVSISRSGNSSAWITFKAVNSKQAKIINNDTSAIDINANYIIIDGFELEAPAYYGCGVASDGGSHHITVKNCWIHDCGQTGIQLNDGDYRTVEGNICNNNGWLMYYCGSGISLWGLIPFDSNPGFHSIVRRNICFGNFNGPETAQTDGNGIIIDDFRMTQGGHTGGTKNINYTGCETLVENNLCYSNGGAGIQIYLTNNVTVRNNTVWNNHMRRTAETWRGNLSASCSANVNFVNNISVANSSLRMDGGSTDYSYFAYNSAIGAFGLSGDMYASNYTYHNNMTYDTNQPSDTSVESNGITVSIIGVNNNRCAVNPQFINPNNTSSANFKLQSTSQAINTGTSAFGLPSIDLDGKARVSGGNVDMGCYEYESSDPNPTVYTIEGDVTGFPVYADSVDYNLGTKFYTTQNGNIVGLRIYGASGESGNHSCYLFNVTNHSTTNLGTWSFNGNNSWITKSITPRAIQTGNDYVISISTGTDSTRRYAVDLNGFGSGGTINGILYWYESSGLYGPKGSSCPTQVYQNNNYLRDILFVPN